MPSFPKMSELPQLLTTKGWVWERFPSDDFWIGTDHNGARWLTKRRGSFSAYREIVFGRLAQTMNWSCQSSVFLKVDRDAAESLEVEPGSIHAAHWCLSEHAPSSCTHHCPISSYYGRQFERVEDIESLGIAHIRDLPKRDIAACLFGGHELSEGLVTTEHEFVIIDSEKMFSSLRVPFPDAGSLYAQDGVLNQSGKRIAREVCEEFASLKRSDIDWALRLPEGVAIDQTWPIAPLVWKSYEFARRFQI